MKRQLAFIIARAQVPVEWLQLPTDEDEDEEEVPSDLLDCLYNSKLSHHFREFGKELGVLDPKSLEDVYKSHLENTRMWLEVTLALPWLTFLFRAWYLLKRRFRSRKSCRNICQRIC